MTLVPDSIAFAAATIEEVEPHVRRRFRNAEVDSDCFDAFVRVPHDARGRVDPREAHALARDLRGGADIDRSVATDWHVLSMRRDVMPSDPGDHQRDREVVGTTIWLSRTYAVPRGYEDLPGNGRTQAERPA